MRGIWREHKVTYMKVLSPEFATELNEDILFVNKSNANVYSDIHD